jgi:hypothetical protein
MYQITTNTCTHYNRPNLTAGNTNCTQGILRLLVTANVMCSCSDWINSIGGQVIPSLLPQPFNTRNFNYKN